MTESVTVSLYLDEETPSLEQLRASAQRCGVSFDMFVTQAILHWAKVREAEIESAPDLGSAEGLAPLAPSSITRSDSSV